ncbi:hypothetical protein CK203_106145 [Vitis vinifera]|uniref:Uncharacterized protein n=1 Tax=Vitis vinifera TaxID=29760 RepID=A0A438C4M7_VITVI|nr:hypothetical protein CK203_106145 [Vitis vinifera]
MSRIKRAVAGDRIKARTPRVESNGAVAGEGATSTVKQPLRYINHPNLTTQPQPQPSMSTSSLEQAILKISKVMEDFVEKVQDSIEKLTNLNIARGKRKLPPQPHHNLQGTNAKRSRKVLKIDTLVGDCYDNSMDQPSIKNHKVQDGKGLLEPFKASTSPGKRRETNSLGPNGKDANFVWDPGGIQHELGKSGVHSFKRCSIWSERKKLWPFEDDCAKLNGNVAAAPNFATVGHVFGALSGAQIMHTISLFEA